MKRLVGLLMLSVLPTIALAGYPSEFVCEKNFSIKKKNELTALYKNKITKNEENIELYSEIRKNLEKNRTNEVIEYTNKKQQESRNLKLNISNLSVVNNCESITNKQYTIRVIKKATKAANKEIESALIKVKLAKYGVDQLHIQWVLDDTLDSITDEVRYDLQIEDKLLVSDFLDLIEIKKGELTKYPTKVWRPETFVEKIKRMAKESKLSTKEEVSNKDRNIDTEKDSSIKDVKTEGSTASRR